MRTIEASDHNGKGLQSFLTLAAMALSVLLCLRMPADAAQADTYAFTITDLQTVLAQALAEKGAGDAIEVTLSNAPEPVLHRAATPMDLHIDYLEFDAKTQRFESTISLYSDEKLARREHITGRFTALVEVPVAAKRIFSGEVIQSHDIVMKPQPEHRLRGQTVFRASDLIGKAARRTLREGQPIEAHEVEAPIVAKRGDMLQVTYRTPYIEIRSLGEALEDGALGSRISLRNPDSQVVMRAIVSAPGMAVIEDTLQLSQHR